MTTVQRSPLDLRPHPLNNLPRWDKESSEWGSFVEDVREHGIQHPILITKGNLVVDGETRRQAAVALQLREIECHEVSDDQVATIILRELLARRNLTKGQLAYTAAPLWDAAFDEGRSRRLQVLNTDQSFEARYRLSLGPDTADEMAMQLGISRTLVIAARRVWGMFREHPELRAQFEPRIMNPDDPIGLGAAVAGMGALLEQRRKEDRGFRHPGGRPESTDKQLRLFAEGWKTLGTRWEYWQSIDEPHRKEAVVAIKASLAATPDDLLETIAKTVRDELKRRRGE